MYLVLQYQVKWREFCSIIEHPGAENV